MRLEIWVLLGTMFLMYDTYHDGRYIKKLFYYKKYYTMGFYAILGLGLVVLLSRKDPLDRKKFIANANNLVQYMPIDKSSMAYLNPLFDFTNNFESNNNYENNYESNNDNNNQKGKQRGTKRSVTETKKKYVAASQNWKCGHCNHQLDHTYEIDHNLRLEFGGSNDIDNLVALCRNCHGKKTASEIM